MQLAISDFNLIQEILYRSTGVKLSIAKIPLVQGRLYKRLRDLKITEYNAYFSLLLRDPQELQRAIDLLTTHETHFFREEHHFDFLKQNEIMQAQNLKAWSAACSSGEEVYSLAMLFGSRAMGTWSILGTDISMASLEIARKGIYPMAASARIPPAYLKLYCLKGTGPAQGLFKIAAALKQKAEFKQLNLLEAEPHSSYQVIFLRNVMIYFDEETRRKALRSVIAHLLPGGFLFTGTAESLRFEATGLTYIRPGIYRLE